MMEAMLIYLSSCSCLLLLSVLFKFFYKFWWTPICIQSKMRSQGIRGPSYKFFYGNSKEIIHMRSGMTTPMELSNQIFPRIDPHVYAWSKLYGRNFLFWLGHKPKLVVTEPELVKQILNDKYGEYPKIEISYFPKKLFGNGLATARGEKWFKQRKLANQAFHGENLKNMIPTMIASVEMMLERWRQYEGKEIDVFQEFKVLTSEIISRTAFGNSYLEGENTFRMLTNMGTIILRNLFKVRIPVLCKLLKTRDDIDIDRLQQDIRESILKMMKKKTTEEVQENESNYLGILMKACNDEDETKSISVDDVIDECKTFYTAGQETTASVLSWTILLLATFNDWQDKARNEVLHLFGQQIPSPKGISRLKTMSIIMNESLRLYPPAIDIMRVTKREAKLGKLIVPANVDIKISVPALHHDPQIWGEDVHHFKPERFAEGVAKATNNNIAAFLPFGLGPRTCVGLNFANIEIKVILSMILQRYRFTLSPTYVHSPIHILAAVRPQHGLQVILHAL